MSAVKSDKSGLMGNDSGVNKMYGSPYLGPNLWEKDQLYSADKLFSDTPKQSSVSSQNSQNNQQQSQNSNSNINFKVESLDIDEFLHENNLNINDIEPFNNFENLNDTTTTSANQGGCLMNQQQFSQQQQQQQSSSSSSNNIHRQTITPDGSSCSPITQINSPMQAAPARSPMQNSIDSSLASSHESYDQKSRKYSEEDLLNKSTQSGGKKSRKVTQDAKFVPDELKDEKYWARRRKNNLAAKRSRDARRMKENQIALRASYLEREADALRKQLEEFKRENKTLRMKLAQYEGTTNGPK
ncbi:unnamed protein product [Didymodactylos carnosus]|uniref:BZIP domain-containing protein n=1 Tax=Didymodactylos carnosus TaxID=1234261 RepID=A0A815L0Q9_9BILA|nr:unnamed protein product [Didymodactylos carnosus]CAF1403445.1 unnamed protein product [Didymodactylos carnosus]CAF4075230.1 unnamed protein product [Didymodactylos carnosus]CAF4296062.1 unnamed protein product [Didymodactylos carnosus]